MKPLFNEQLKCHLPMEHAFRGLLGWFHCIQLKGLPHMNLA